MSFEHANALALGFLLAVGKLALRGCNL